MLKGMLTLANLQTMVEQGDVETVLTVFPDLYGRLMGKRIDADYFLEYIAEGGMHACDYLLTTDMEMDVVEGYKFANWERGYGDFHCLPDLSTLRQVTWLEKSALVLCDVETEPGHEPVGIAPRTMLKGQLARLAEAGFQANMASEIEYYIFKETYDSAKEKHFEDLNTFGWYLEDYHMLQGSKEDALNGAARRHMTQSGIPVEFSKGEWGPGQHELNLRYAPALEMADRHVIYKQGFKEIALAQGLAVTFMAKWRSDLSGSSCHIHLSLWGNDSEQNAFVGEGQFGPVQVSDLFRWFLGGWMAHTQELMPFYAPNPNSYKRYSYQSWAPTNIAWSYDNRTAGFRVVGRGPSLRIECRIPGADVNPYLAYAASIAAGLHGIENQIEPPPMFEGDVYGATDLPRVPASLRQAADALEASAMLRAAFGDEVVDHYVHFFRTEQRKYDEAVTGWERARYFERI
jgi:glutamine synthetase